jgi:outer membrane protein TolC
LRIESRTSRTWVGVVVAVLCGPVVAYAQAVPAEAPRAVTLEQALLYAVDHYPTVRAALEQVSASTANVTVAHAAYLPRLDALWQSNRGTVNNVFGQVLPQSVIPAMSGPVLPLTSGQSVWGSATGAFLSWEPLDFGLRRAGVFEAEAALSQARADEALTRLDVQRAVGEGFLAVLLTERHVAAARADFDRREVLSRTVQTLVDNQLRPGAEASRAAAERAAAQTRLIRAQETQTIAQATLARVLGIPAGTVAVEPGTLLEAAPPLEVSAPLPATHPLALVHQATLDAARAQEHVLARMDLPRVFLQSSLSSRGSGANPNGRIDGGLGGLGLDRINWAAGVQVVVSNLFDFSSLRARKAAAAASERAEMARYDEALLTVTSGQRTAAAIVRASRAIAANTPVQLAAAQQGEAQARARYEAGLTSIIEVADAQGLLAQAEAEDQLAHVDVWRALLAAAAADGDLTPFIRLIQPTPGPP